MFKRNKMKEDWETEINKELEFRCCAKGCRSIIAKPLDNSLSETLCFTCHRIFRDKLKR